MPIIYADIAFPNAVRQVFTYETRDVSIKPGMRVWVPLRKEFAIGMVVNVHDKKPDFKTRPVERILDRDPIMSATMLQLTEWIHRFYYCSWGEAIQAALPVGLNFSSEKKLKVKKGFKGKISEEEFAILEEIKEKSITLKDAEKRWRDGKGKTFFKKALKQGWITIWEEPRQKVDFKKVKHWRIRDGIEPEPVLEELTEKEL